MLRAFKSQLNLLDQDPRNQFVMKLKLILGESFTEEKAARARGMVLLLPEMLSQIQAWNRDQRVPAPLRKLHGVTLTYLYHPADLLPDEPYGLLGYLDDAYLAAWVYEHTMRQMDADSRPYLPHHEDISRSLPAFLETAREILPRETRRLDAMLTSYLSGDEGAFGRLLEETSPTEETTRP